MANKQLIDRYNRHINYARLSVTDRCDLRCVYCMTEQMHFLPRKDILSLEELLTTGKALVAAGIEKLRITGGEPLVRNNVLWLIEKLAALTGLQELTLTTNGTQLEKFSKPLRDAGVKRINVSLDSLRPERFKELTRVGNLEDVINGINAASIAGFERIKLNSVILKGRNDDEIIPLIQFAIERGTDIAFIEEMPLGSIVEHNRGITFIPSSAVRKKISTRYSLIPSNKQTNGPARYWHIAGTQTDIGFISPHSNNFCHLCNRVRVTAEGKLLLCLGNEHAIDIRKIIRQSDGEPHQTLVNAIQQSMLIKPERHEFSFDNEPQVIRLMNMTGG